MSIILIAVSSPSTTDPMDADNLAAQAARILEELTEDTTVIYGNAHDASVGDVNYALDKVPGRISVDY